MDCHRSCNKWEICTEERIIIDNHSKHCKESNRKRKKNQPNIQVSPLLYYLERAVYHAFVSEPSLSVLITLILIVFVCTYKLLARQFSNNQGCI